MSYVLYLLASYDEASTDDEYTSDLIVPSLRTLLYIYHVSPTVRYIYV